MARNPTLHSSFSSTFSPASDAQTVAMSHEVSSKHRKSSARNYYPTRWSEWEWSEQYQCDARYREVSKGACSPQVRSASDQCEVGNWEWDYSQPYATEAQEHHNQAVKPRRRTSRQRSADTHGNLGRSEEQTQDEYEDSYETNFSSSIHRVPYSNAPEDVSGITQGLADAKIDTHSEAHPYQGENQYSEDYSEHTAGVVTHQDYEGCQPIPTPTHHDQCPTAFPGAGQSYYSAFQAPHSAETPGYGYS
jgi:hypothetical protein